MTRRMDLGQKIVALAAELTPEQVAELLAVARANMHIEQTPTHPSHWRKDGIYGPLVRKKLIVGQVCPEWHGRGWKRALLTNVGQRVLLHIAEDAMIASGRMVPFTSAEVKA